MSKIGPEQFWQNLKPIEGIRFISFVLVCLALLPVQSLASSQAQAESSYQVCHLLNQAKSPESLIRESSLNPEQESRMRDWFLKINFQQDIASPMESYYVLLIWQKKIQNLWSVKNCYQLGRISFEDLQESLSEASPRAQIFQKTKWASALDMSSLSVNPTPPTLDKKKSEVKETSIELKERNINFDQRFFYASPLLAYDFINGEGSDIFNQLEAFSFGLDLGFSYEFKQNIFLFAQSRIKNYKVSYAKNAEVINDEDLQTEYGLGLGMSLFESFNLRVSYLFSQEVLFERSVPIHYLNLKKINIHSLHMGFQWSLYKGETWDLGLQGDYGRSFLKQDSEATFKYKSWLYINKKYENYDLGLRVGYELTKYYSKPSQIAEINKNSYPLYLVWTRAL